MITALSLNPSIDRTLCVDDFCKGGLNRVVSHTDVAAGKGVNVALAAAAMGVKSACIGFMYTQGRDLFEKRLGDAGVEYEFIVCEGTVRVNTKVMDLSRSEITELNQSGVATDASQLDQMAQLVYRYAQKSEYLVLSGSLPPGCGTDYYAYLTQTIAGTSCRVVLDADGERLRAGIAAHPFLIKPNRYELEMLTGRSLSTKHDILEAALWCIDMGAENVAVSMGGEGALITNGAVAYTADALKVEIASTVAAGDSMIAGLTAAFTQGADLERAFCRGMATAAARCATPPDRMIDADLAAALEKSITTEKIRL